MPGYVIHLALAEKILRDCNADYDFANRFRLGSMAPDTIKREDKKESHFWSDDMFRLFVRKPDLDAFMYEYERKMSDPFVLGYYAHLVLDIDFLDIYWKKHFDFRNDDNEPALLYDDVTKVYIKETGNSYSRQLFLSDEMYYGDYDRMNEYFIGKYKLQKPIVDIKEFPIKELESVKTYEALQKMSSVFDREVYENNIPQLKVFKLEDMEKLINDTAVKLTGSRWFGK